MTTRIQRSCQALRRASFSVNEFVEFTAPGVSFEEATSSDYWMHVLRQLKANDVITIIAHDGSYDATLRITRIGGTSLEFRTLRMWRAGQEESLDSAGAQQTLPQPADAWDRDHLVCCKNPESNATGWVFAHRSSQASEWQFPLKAIKHVCVTDAINQSLSRALSANLTISTAPPQSVLDDPESVPAGYAVTVLCPEKRGSAKRWVILTADARRGFHINRQIIGGDIKAFLETMAADKTSPPFDKSVFKIRPGMVAANFLPGEENAPRSRRAA